MHCKCSLGGVDLDSEELVSSSISNDNDKLLIGHNLSGRDVVSNSGRVLVLRLQCSGVRMWD